MMTSTDDPAAPAQDAPLKQLDSLFEKALSYTNLLMVAGYASFFGLWSLTELRIASGPALWAALLMALSVTVFALYQVGASVWVVVLLWKIINPDDRGWFAAQRSAVFAQRVQITVWCIAMLLMVLPGFGALAVLMGAYVQALWFCRVPYACG